MHVQGGGQTAAAAQRSRSRALLCQGARLLQRLITMLLHNVLLVKQHAKRLKGVRTAVEGT
jgi:hypothetical protein